MSDRKTADLLRQAIPEWKHRVGDPHGSHRDRLPVNQCLFDDELPRQRGNSQIESF
jgi:hypothetical protein